MGYKNVCVNCRISLSEGTNYELFNRNKTCPTCKGKGKVFDHVAGIMTLGFAYLLGKETCPQCYGKGYIKIK